VTALSIVAALLVTVLAVLGLAKVFAVPRFRELASDLGFTPTDYRRIGALELAAAAGLVVGSLVPAIGGLAAAGVLLLLGGALAVHVRNGDGPKKLAPAAVTAALTIAYLLLLGASR
jgi:DoxX-like family